jgi:pyrroline-5-carboxylate reductase
MKTMGFIGCGNMGGSIIRSVGPTKKWRTLVYDVRQEVAESVAQASQAQACTFDELLQDSDIIVLAVKPQILPTLYPVLQGYREKTWISMAAGVSLDTLASSLGSVEVARIMPNLAASVQKAVTAVAVHPEASADLAELVMQFASTFGSAHRIAEQHFAPFIGVSGSGIASAFAYLHGIALGGVHEGLPYQTALDLICDTVESATALIRAGKTHPEELLTQVCSPGGTTIEMVQILDEQAFRGTLMQAVEAASQKALLLEEQAKTR